MMANRNGFFYVLDRVTGKFMLAQAVRQHDVGQARSARTARRSSCRISEPTPKGTVTCPDLYGGTNFMSPSFDASDGLFFVTARETCVTASSSSAARRLQGRRSDADGRPRSVAHRERIRRAARDRPADRRAQVGDRVRRRRLGRRAGDGRRRRLQRRSRRRLLRRRLARPARSCSRTRPARRSTRRRRRIDRRAAVCGDAVRHDADRFRAAGVARRPRE